MYTVHADTDKDGLSQKHRAISINEIRIHAFHLHLRHARTHISFAWQ